MITRRDILQRISTPLTALYGEREARQIALVAVSERTGLRIAELLADPTAPLEIAGLDRMIAELSEGRPLQYVLGSAEFCGLQISVCEGVLIPRPETEELVQWIVQENPEAHRLLDVGTGSGCIALALKYLLPKASVTGTDISDEALTVARRNAASLNFAVEFVQADALNNLAKAFTHPFDAIVSNPPYIPQVERLSMHRNVTSYEPDMALFVPDEDPLRFYRAIAQAARTMLAEGGRLYYEVHERFGNEVCALLLNEGFTQVVLRRDFHDKPRMVCCQKGR